jgi:hypothetical protein
LFGRNNDVIDGGALALDPAVVTTLRAQLAEVADRTVDAVTREVGEYAALEDQVGDNIRRAVQLALATFLRLAAQSADTGDDEPMQPALEGAYALGRGEARSGRTMDALLAAYRVGARAAWREWSSTAVGNGLPAHSVARFAELVFAFIDELSAASAAGHTDELARSGRVRQQYRERLAVALLSGAPDDELVRRADRADWTPPATLTAVLLPSVHVRGAVAVLDARTLVAAADEVGGPEDSAVLLVPHAERTRPALLSAVRDRRAVVGPARPWTAAASSFRRALRAATRLSWTGGAALDTEQHLLELVLAADSEALADLRSRALAPLEAVRPAAAERLAETLRVWLLLQGRRDEVAAALHVHPQTVRYRMTQVRELYGERLSDPDVVAQLVVALARPDAATAPRRQA